VVSVKEVPPGGLPAAVAVGQEVHPAIWPPGGLADVARGTWAPPPGRLLDRWAGSHEPDRGAGADALGGRDGGPGHGRRRGRALPGRSTCPGGAVCALSLRARRRSNKHPIGVSVRSGRRAPRLDVERQHRQPPPRRRRRASAW
jgi:hypothetical protein